MQAFGKLAEGLPLASEHCKLLAKTIQSRATIGDWHHDHDQRILDGLEDLADCLVRTNLSLLAWRRPDPSRQGRVHRKRVTCRAFDLTKTLFDFHRGLVL